MKLRLLAPFRSHFCLTLGHAVKAGQASNISNEYVSFWDSVQKRFDSEGGAGLLSNVGNAAFMHCDAYLKNDDGPRYARIDADATSYTDEVITLRPESIPALDDGKLDRIIGILSAKRPMGYAAYTRLSTLMRAEPDSILIRVFDNNISLLEAGFDINKPIGDLEEADYEAFCVQLREAAVFLGEILVFHYYETVVFPLFRWLDNCRTPEDGFIEKLRSDNPAYRFFATGRSSFTYPLGPDFDNSPAGVNVPPTEVLWVTRSLICEPEDSGFVDVSSLVRAWLLDVGESAQRDQAIKDPAAYCAHWLNYVFREDFWGTTHADDIWSAMTLCQYYYAALDCLNQRLNAVISLSNRDSAEMRVKALREVLDVTVQRATVLLLNFNEIQNYMSRRKLSAFSEIMTYWNFDRFQQTTLERMRVCRERIDDLHRRSTEKSSLYSEFFLFAIGLLAVLDLGIGLAMFGRSPSDPAFAQDERYSGTILAYFAGLPASTIIVTAFAAMGLLATFYIRIRNRRRSL
jgi:hypothetical protein